MKSIFQCIFDDDMQGVAFCVENGMLEYELEKKNAPLGYHKSHKDDVKYDNSWLYPKSSPLAVSVFFDKEQIAKYLIQCGANVNNNSRSNITPLMNAARQGHYQIAQLLIENGAKVDAKDSYGYTPLLWSARNGFANICKLLIQHGANPNAIDEGGQNALCKAIYHNHHDVAVVLLECGVDVNFVNQQGNNALMMACVFERKQTAKYLIDFVNKQYLNMQNNDGQTALMLSCKNNMFEIVKYLVQSGADIMIKDKDGNNAFCLCALFCQVDSAKYLYQISQNSNIDMINCKNHDNNTPLLLCCENGHGEMIDFLLEKNCDINHINKNGENALDIAKKYSFDSILQKIQSIII